MATAAKSSLASSMAAAFAEIEAATKASKNPHFKSSYADLSTVIEAVKPALIAHGLFFTQHCHPSETGVIVETVLTHQDGEEKSLGKLYVPANKQDPQGFGSALTYARRYSLLTAFGVPTEDDDGNAGTSAVRNNRTAANSNGGKIDDAQYATLVTLMENKRVTTKRFCGKYEIDRVSDLPARLYDDAVAALNAIELEAA
jgi:hypothetical protein